VLLLFGDALHGAQATGPIWTYCEPYTDEEGGVSSIVAAGVTRRATIAFRDRLSDVLGDDTADAGHTEHNPSDGFWKPAGPPWPMTRPCSSSIGKAVTAATASPSPAPTPPAQAPRPPSRLPQG
jgi:hypothetical protein